MSEKKRQKKDGRRKDKKSQAMRGRENESVQESRQREQARDQSNLTDTQPGAADTSGRR